MRTFDLGVVEKKDTNHYPKNEIFGDYVLLSEAQKEINELESKIKVKDEKIVELEEALEELRDEIKKLEEERVSI